MDVGRPYLAICPTLDSAVLAVLGGTTRPLTGRQVARLLGRTSPGGVPDVLNRLSQHGLVDRQEAGRALLFTLNRDHVAAPVVEVLMGLRAELLRRIRHLIAEWEVPAVHASMFGSAARGDGDTASDIDIFVVRSGTVSEDDPRWRSQLDRLTAQIRRWTGNHASLAEIAEGELDRLRRDDPSILRELRSQAILLGGRELPALLGSPP
jgi:predicted nucleotidyltransferase